MTGAYQQCVGRRRSGGWTRRQFLQTSEIHGPGCGANCRLSEDSNAGEQPYSLKNGDTRGRRVTNADGADRGTPTSGPHTCARRRILLVRSEQKPLNVMTEPRIARRKPRNLLRRKTRYISVLYPQRNLEHVRILFVALVNIE